MKKVVIIGAGIGGLATANMLAKAGMDVSVYEKNDQPGGRAGCLEIDGFRFDTGPSWYLMPEVFAHYFEMIGEDVEHELTLKRLDPGYKVLFEDGESLNITGNFSVDAKTFERVQPGSSDILHNYLHSAEHTYEIATKYFLYNNFNSVRNVLNKEVVMAGPRMALSAAKSIHESVASNFSNLKLQQVLEYPAVFLGASPFSAPAVYTLMSHLDFKQGVYYPMGGLYEIITSLVKIGKKLGVKYRYNSPITKILTENGHATGITYKGKTIPADYVISNADLHFTETTLLPPEAQSYPESYWHNKNPGPSALLMYIGIEGKLPKFEHHNLFFTNEWESNFDKIFNRKEWPNPASIYVCVPSKTDPSVAPKGMENVFVLVPGPARTGDDPKDIEKLADMYLDQIAKMSDTPNLKKRIKVKRLFTPDDFAHHYNSWQGTALGLAHTLKQSAIFRPQNKSKRVDNLYYVGANTVPGIGLPMCLIGAELVYKRIIGDTSSGPLKERIQLK